MSRKHHPACDMAVIGHDGPCEYLAVAGRVQAAAPLPSSGDDAGVIGGHAVAAAFGCEDFDKVAKESLGRFLGEYGGRMFKEGYAAGRTAAFKECEAVFANRLADQRGGPVLKALREMRAAIAARAGGTK